MSKVLGGAGVIAALALAMGFASLNSGQRVTLRLGLITLYGVPLTVVAFGSVLAGMVVMLVAGVRSDLKVRSILRARLETECGQDALHLFGFNFQAGDCFDAWRPQNHFSAFDWFRISVEHVFGRGAAGDFAN